MGDDRVGSRVVELMYGPVRDLSVRRNHLSDPNRQANSHHAPLVFSVSVPRAASWDRAWEALSLLSHHTRAKRKVHQLNQLVMFVLQDHEVLVFFRAGLFYPDEIDPHGRILSKVRVQGRDIYPRE